MFLAANIQMRSTTNQDENWNQLENLLERTSKTGASFVVTPENTLFLGPQFHKVDIAEEIPSNTTQRLGALAKKYGIHLLIGSIAEKVPNNDNKCYNTSVFFDPKGELIAKYQKMHLFDVDVPGGLCIKESDSIISGDDLVVVDTELGKIGLSICYDLRFPEMFRALVDRGAEMIVVPSAFTLTTGKDHWHALLRARAIETQCWIIAPGQWGTHDEKGIRKSYGHSLIIDPWGVVRSDCGQGIGYGVSEIDLDYMYSVRSSIPVINHRKI